MMQQGAHLGNFNNFLLLRPIIFLLLQEAASRVGSAAEWARLFDEYFLKCQLAIVAGFGSEQAALTDIYEQLFEEIIDLFLVFGHSPNR